MGLQEKKGCVDIAGVVKVAPKLVEHRRDL